MNHKTHLYLMVGVAVAAVLLFSTGNAGGWALYVWLGACAVMMFVMMRGMGGMGGGRGRGGDGRRHNRTVDGNSAQHWA
jgi:hypothetical protein